MAYINKRVIILAACSVSVLALTIAYYWQLRKRRKSIASSDNNSSTNNTTTINNDRSEEEESENSISRLLIEETQKLELGIDKTEEEEDFVNIDKEASDSYFSQSTTPTTSNDPTETLSFDYLTSPDSSREVKSIIPSPETRRGSINKTHSEIQEEVMQIVMTGKEFEAKPNGGVVAMSPPVVKSSPEKNNIAGNKKGEAKAEPQRKKSSDFVDGVAQSKQKKSEAKVTKSPASAQELKKKEDKSAKRDTKNGPQSNRSASFDGKADNVASSTNKSHPPRDSLSGKPAATPSRVVPAAGGPPSFAQVLSSSSSCESSLKVDRNVAMPPLESAGPKTEQAQQKQPAQAATTTTKPANMTVEHLHPVKATYSQIVNSSAATTSSSAKMLSETTANPASQQNLATKEVVNNATSTIGDNHSQGSADSGQGYSDSDMAVHNGTDSSLSPGEPESKAAAGAGQAAMSSSTSSSPVFGQPNECVYQFKVPFDLCGQLIGTKGHTIKGFKSESRTHIVIIDGDSYDSENKICQIKGTGPNVEKALALIRKRFPLSIFPNLTMESLSVLHSSPPPPPAPVVSLSQSCQLQLPPDVRFEAVISVIIDAGHFFLQQPTHPTYSKLAELDMIMTRHYNQNMTPILPQWYPGLIVVAPYEDNWYRVLIRSIHEEAVEPVPPSTSPTVRSVVDLIYVDHGGYEYNVPVENLRQIHADFLSLPFQATECCLYNVQPIDAEEGWSAEAISFIKDAGNHMVSALVKCFEDGIPMVELYRYDNQTVSIAKELVDNGFAEWIEEP